MSWNKCPRSIRAPLKLISCELDENPLPICKTTSPMETDEKEQRTLPLECVFDGRFRVLASEALVCALLPNINPNVALSMAGNRDCGRQYLQKLISEAIISGDTQSVPVSSRSLTSFDPDNLFVIRRRDKQRHMDDVVSQDFLKLFVSLPLPTTRDVTDDPKRIGAFYEALFVAVNNHETMWLQMTKDGDESYTPGDTVKRNKARIFNKTLCFHKRYQQMMRFLKHSKLFDCIVEERELWELGDILRSDTPYVKHSQQGQRITADSTRALFLAQKMLLLPYADWKKMKESKKLTCNLKYMEYMNSVELEQFLEANNATYMAKAATLIKQIDYLFKMTQMITRTETDMCDWNEKIGMRNWNAQLTIVNEMLLDDVSTYDAIDPILIILLNLSNYQKCTQNKLQSPAQLQLIIKDIINLLNSTTLLSILRNDSLSETCHMRTTSKPKRHTLKMFWDSLEKENVVLVRDWLATHRFAQSDL